MIHTQLSHRLSPISVHVKEAGEGQAFIVASVKSPADAREAASLLYTQIAEVLSKRGMAGVHERIFGSLSVEHDVMSARRQAFTSFGISPENPVTYIEGNPPWGAGLAGVIIHAVKADEVWTVMDSGVPCGRGWRRGGSTYLILQNIIYGRAIIPTNMYPKVVIPAIPNLFGSRASFREDQKDSGQAGMTVSENPKFLNCRSNSIPRPEQACLMIERAERILRENGASYSDVVRTWFYLSDILGWYAGFNKVRNEKYGEFGIMPGPGDRELLLPASTGIAGNSRAGASCAMDLIAVIGNNENGENTLHNTLPLIPSLQGRGNNPPSPLVGEGKGEGEGEGEGEHLTKTRPSIRRLTNPSQLDAFRYGSAFARASVVRNGSTYLIEVSGTAAIDEHGVSLYPGDIRSQINCTFDKIDSLLKQEGAELKDICSATVFVKHGEYAETFHEMATARGLGDFPCVCVVADVCREELLFEIDAEAVVRREVKEEFS